MSQEGWSKDEAVATCDNQGKWLRLVRPRKRNGGTAPFWTRPSLEIGTQRRPKRKSASSTRLTLQTGGCERPGQQGRLWDWRTYSFFEARLTSRRIHWSVEPFLWETLKKTRCTGTVPPSELRKSVQWKSCAMLGRGWDDEFQLTLAGVSLKILGLLKMIVGFPMKSTGIYRIVVYLSTSKELLQANSLLVGIRTGYNFPWTMLLSGPTCEGSCIVPAETNSGTLGIY